MITDERPSRGAAKREPMLGIEHRQHEGLDNRAGNSHQPRRRREQQVGRFKPVRQARRLLSAGQINSLIHLRRDHISGSGYQAARAGVFDVWTDISGVAAAV